MIERLIKISFSLLIILIPVNLGLHFITTDAYVRARLMDYLVPTIWLQDVLILWVLILSLTNKSFKPSKRLVRFGLVFLAAFLPSVFVGENVTASGYFFARLVLYVLFTLFISSNTNPVRDLPKITKLLAISTLFLGILAIFQWRGQGSVFDNYLILGEQPYDSSTFNTARVSVLGELKIPAYGTFRHPNTFAGFLAIALFWIYSELRIGIKSRLLKLAFLSGFIGLILTFSQVAMVSLFLSLAFFLLIKSFGRKGVLLSVGVTAAIFILALFLPIISTYGDLQSDPSIFRRTNLLKSAYQMMEEKPAFGVGLNNFTVALQGYLPLSQILVFNQPAHSIFALVGAESGIFALMALLAVFIISAAGLLKHSFGYPAVLFISILQIFILGSLDHYIWTSHQTQILSWLTLGLALAYTDRDAQV